MCSLFFFLLRLVWPFKKKKLELTFSRVSFCFSLISHFTDHISPPRVSNFIIKRRFFFDFSFPFSLSYIPCRFFRPLSNKTSFFIIIIIISTPRRRTLFFILVKWRKSYRGIKNELYNYMEEEKGKKAKRRKRSFAKNPTIKFLRFVQLWQIKTVSRMRKSFFQKKKVVLTYFPLLLLLFPSSSSHLFSISPPLPSFFLLSFFPFTPYLY